MNLSARIQARTSVASTQCSRERICQHEMTLWAADAEEMENQASTDDTKIIRLKAKLAAAEKARDEWNVKFQDAWDGSSVAEAGMLEWQEKAAEAEAGRAILREGLERVRDHHAGPLREGKHAPGGTTQICQDALDLGDGVKAAAVLSAARRYRIAKRIKNPPGVFFGNELALAAMNLERAIDEMESR